LLEVAALSVHESTTVSDRLLPYAAKLRHLLSHQVPTHLDRFILRLEIAKSQPPNTHPEHMLMEFRAPNIQTGR
jgi:hypothetical protein